MRDRRWASRVTLALASVAVLAGCASGQSVPARQAAERFYEAVRGGQGEAACGLLIPQAAEQVGSGDEGCARSILRLGLPTGAGTRLSPQAATRVWGQEAQVRLAGDTVFLHRFARGWLVRAAGCEPRGERPYQCKVGG
jgi:hypothetical protein